MIVHFEGLDLAGKSTTCRRFAEQAPGEWQLRRNRLTLDNPVHDLTDRYRLDGRFSRETLGELYLASLLVDLEMWEPPAFDVVQDSTIIVRSYVFYETHGDHAVAARFRELFERHPRFDKTFVCTCDREVRLARLARRRPENLGPEDFLVRDHPEFFAEMEACLIETVMKHFDAEVVDTGTSEQDESVAFIVEKVPGLLSD